MLKGTSQLELQETVVEDNEKQRVITRYVPIGMKKENALDTKGDC